MPLTLTVNSKDILHEKNLTVLIQKWELCSRICRFLVIWPNPNSVKPTAGSTFRKAYSHLISELNVCSEDCFLPVFFHHPYRQHTTAQSQSCGVHRGSTPSLYCAVVCQSITRSSRYHKIKHTHTHTVRASISLWMHSARQTGQSDYSLGHSKNMAPTPHHIRLS